MAFSLTFSHVGLFVNRLQPMLDFYTRILGFAESDRGRSSNGGDIVFLTRDPREHHQFVLATGRPGKLEFNLINQLSFRVDSLDTLRDLRNVLEAEGVDELRTVTHGNALSVYCRDPEGNRVELLIDTPWYVPQPQRIPVDFSLSDADLWATVERTVRAIPGFKSRAEWVADIEQRIAQATARRRTAAAA